MNWLQKTAIARYWVDTGDDGHWESWLQVLDELFAESPHPQAGKFGPGMGEGRLGKHFTYSNEANTIVAHVFDHGVPLALTVSTKLGELGRARIDTPYQSGPDMINDIAYKIMTAVYKMIDDETNFSRDMNLDTFISDEEVTW